MSIYYSPEHYGLETVGEVDWSSGGYEFDYTAVWRDTSTGQFYYAEDSGCSCPAPFDGVGRPDLTPIPGLEAFQTYLSQRNSSNLAEEWRSPYDRTSEIVALVEKLHAAGLR